MKFVQTKKPGICGVKRCKASDDHGGLCAPHDEIVRLEGLDVPAHIRTPQTRGRGRPAAPAPASETPKAPKTLVQQPEPLRPGLPAATMDGFRAMLQTPAANLAAFESVAEVIPLRTQEGWADAERALRAVHELGQGLNAWLQHYVAPLKELEKQYRDVFRPYIKQAERTKGRLRARMAEALQAAQAAQRAAVAEIEQAATAGREIPDDAIQLADGLQPGSAGVRRTLRWRFAAGRDYTQLPMDLLGPDTGKIDHALASHGEKLSEITDGVLETYEDVSIITPKKGT